MTWTPANTEQAEGRLNRRKVVMKLRISPTVQLLREHPHKGDLIAWSVVESIPDKKHSGVRKGVIVKRLNNWFPRRFGWQTHPEPYWVGFRTNGGYVIGRTRAEVLYHLLTPYEIKVVK